MSLLKFYGTLNVLSYAYSWTKYSYEKIQYWTGPKQPEWDEKQALKNFKLICQSTPKQLSGRICSKKVIEMTPYLHQGNLGYESKAECDAALKNAMGIGERIVGTVAFLIPVARYFNGCLSSGTVGSCAKSGIEDLCSFSGLRLFTGAFVVSTFVSGFLIGPLVHGLIADFPVHRTLLIGHEYGAMLRALNEILELPADDQRFIETAQLSKQFLRLTPYIEQELHKSCALDVKDAKELLFFLKTACRQILIKQAYPVPVEAKPPSAPPAPVAGEAKPPSAPQAPVAGEAKPPSTPQAPAPDPKAAEKGQESPKPNV